MKLQQSTNAAAKCNREVDPNEGTGGGVVEGSRLARLKAMPTWFWSTWRPVDSKSNAQSFRSPPLPWIGGSMSWIRSKVKIRFDEKAACPDALRRVHYRRAEWKRSAVSPKKAAWAFARFLRRHASVEVLREDLTTFRVAQLASHNSQFDGPVSHRMVRPRGCVPAGVVSGILHAAAGILAVSRAPAAASARRFSAGDAAVNTSASRSIRPMLMRRWPMRGPRWRFTEPSSKQSTIWH